MTIRISRLVSLPALLGIVALAAFGPVQSIRAASFETGGLKITYDGPAALTFGNIKPGDSNRKQFTVQNVSSVDQNIAIGATTFADLLSTSLLVTPDINGTPIWTRTLASLSGTATTGIEITPILSPGFSVTLGVTISLPSTAANEFQGLVSDGFSIVIGSQIGLPETTPTPSPGDGGNGGDGTGGGDNRPAAAPGGQFDGQPLALLAPGNIATNNAAQPNTLTDGAGNQSPSPSVNNVLGAATSQNLPDCFWWWLLPVIFAALLVAYRVVGNKRKIAFESVWPAVVAIGTIALHLYLHTWYREVAGCDYTTYIVIAELAIYYVFLFKQGKNE